MIDLFYKNFEPKDYMNEDSLKLGLTKNTLDCSLGTNPFIKEDLIEKYIVEEASEINKYPSLQYDLLKNELIDFFKSYIYDGVNKDNIAFGSGTMGILRNLCEFLVKENTKVLGIAPQFTRFLSEIELKKGIYEYYSLDKNNNYKFITSDFIKKINNTYDLIYIDNPNNPTGQIIDVDDIEKIVKKAKEYNIFVIIDEAYGDYMTYSNSAIKLVELYNNIIVLKSASKFYGLPNHRIGYMFASKNLIEIYNRISLPFAFSDLSASIFIKILKNYKDFENTKQKTKEIKMEILNSLKKENYLYTNSETPIFTIKTDKYENLSKELLNNGIISENCDFFINLNSTFARLRINEDYKKLIKILKNLL